MHLLRKRPDSMNNIYSRWCILKRTFKTRIANIRKYVFDFLLLLLCELCILLLSIYCCCFVVQLPSWWIKLPADGSGSACGVEWILGRTCTMLMVSGGCCCETVCVLYIDISTAAATWEICGGLSLAQVYKWDEWWRERIYRTPLIFHRVYSKDAHF